MSHDYEYPRSTANRSVERAVRDGVERLDQSAGRLRSALDATLDAIAEDRRRQHERASARHEIHQQLQHDNQRGRT